MKKIIKRYSKLYTLLKSIKKYLRIFYNKKAFGTYMWNLRKGDDKLSLDYPLNNDSIFFDVGGYTGEFTEKIINKFNCYSYIFEPSNEFFKIIEKKFNNKPNIFMINSALSDYSGISHLGGGGTGSSIVKKGGNEEVSVISFKDFIDENKITNIDYLKLNIEGSEYELLEHIIEIGFIKNINHIQVQFHNFVPDAGKKRKNLRTKLKKTHGIVFNFPFVWERWDLKK